MARLPLIHGTAQYYGCPCGCFPGHGSVGAGEKNREDHAARPAQPGPVDHRGCGPAGEYRGLACSCRPELRSDCGVSAGPGHAIFEALDQQTVVVVGTDTAGMILPQLAAQLEQLQAQRKAIAVQIAKLVEEHPLSEVLTSVPGIGTRTAGIILAEVCGKSFQTAAHLSSYAGIAPVTRRSGTSIRGEHRSKRGNKKLKRALYLAAFASLKNPVSRTYYDRKRAEGMRHHQAIMALTRKRCNVLFAMLRDGALFDGKLPGTA